MWARASRCRFVDHPRSGRGCRHAAEALVFNERTVIGLDVHARSVRALERVRLAEVHARGASPPTPPDALLRKQAVRVRLEAAEARRRARVLVAQAHTRAAAEALSSER